MTALGRRISIVFAALLGAAAVLVLAPGAPWSQEAPAARVLDGGGDASYVAGELVVTYESGGAAEVAEADWRIRL